MRQRSKVDSVQNVYLYGRKLGQEMQDDPTVTAEPTYKRMSYTKCWTDNMSGGSASYSYKDWLGNWSTPIDISVTTPLALEQHAFIEQPTLPSFDDPLPPAPGFFMKDLGAFGKSKLNAPVMLFELAQTLTMLSRPWKLAAALASSGKRLRLPRDLKGAINAIGSEYLGFRYGWRPFLADVRAIRETTTRFKTAQRFLEDGDVFTFKSNRTSVDSRTSRVDYPYPTYDMRTTCVTNTTKKHTRCEFGKAQKSASYETQSMARHIIDAYGGADFATIAWELVPNSFVVDWFLPVGDMIKANLSSPAWFTNVSSPWAWDKFELVSAVSRSGVHNSRYQTNVGWQYTVSKETFARGPIVTVPPKPVDIDGYQVADLLAMAGQQWGRLLGKSF